MVERLSFDAHGKRRLADWQAGTPATPGAETPRGFTGHEHLDGVELIHMNGRVYDPTLGRFLSPDPFVFEPISTQGFNRYAYVSNKPLSFTDPSGFASSSMHSYAGPGEYVNGAYRLAPIKVTAKANPISPGLENSIGDASWSQWLLLNSRYRSIRTSGNILFFSAGGASGSSSVTIRDSTGSVITSTITVGVYDPNTLGCDANCQPVGSTPVPNAAAGSLSVTAPALNSAGWQGSVGETLIGLGAGLGAGAIVGGAAGYGVAALTAACLPCGVAVGVAALAYAGYGLYQDSRNDFAGVSSFGNSVGNVFAGTATAGEAFGVGFAGGSLAGGIGGSGARVVTGSVFKARRSVGVPVGAADDAARSSANAARLRGQLAGNKIAGGHAFEKHVIQRGEFTGLGIRTREQFARHIENVVNNPSASRQLSGGRTAFWDDATGTVVIRNPRAADGGTAFRPTAGREYFEGLR